VKIAIIVHGRFHAFDLARELIKRGNDVTVFTNYPKWAVRRFGIEPEHVRSCWPHGILSRVLSPISNRCGIDPQPWLNPLFERWAVKALNGKKWDVVHAFSGVAERVIDRMKRRETVCLMVRGSAHIRTQDRILGEEAARTGRPIERPTPWIIAREQREYAAADRIVVLSSFAYHSFVYKGVDPKRLRMLSLGTNTAAFRPAPAIIEERIRRIRSGAPLRILYTGLLALRKGLADLAVVAQQNSDRRFEFRCVGAVTPEARSLLKGLAGSIEYTPKVPQQDLPAIYSAADVFLFPTQEDGYAVVLAQANASGLPIITTPNCCGPDLLEENKSGWIIPIRDPQAILDRLHWCHTHREELAQMVRYISTGFQPRDWNDVAADFEQLCVEALEERRANARSEVSGR
jgi:glycosyltransferase involved in cell wall biosynthesis